MTNFILGHNKAKNPPSWGSFARLGLSLGHGLAPGRIPVTGFSAPSQPKTGKKRNRMSLLIRKALSGVEGVVGSLATLSHECGGLIGETRSEWSEKRSWSGWSRGCLISFQRIFSSPHLPAVEWRSQSQEPRALDCHQDGGWWPLPYLWSGLARPAEIIFREIWPQLEDHDSSETLCKVSQEEDWREVLGRTSRNHFQPIRRVDPDPVPHAAGLYACLFVFPSIHPSIHFFHLLTIHFMNPPVLWWKGDNKKCLRELSMCQDLFRCFTNIFSFTLHNHPGGVMIIFIWWVSKWDTARLNNLHKFNQVDFAL